MIHYVGRQARAAAPPYPTVAYSRPNPPITNNPVLKPFFLVQVSWDGTPSAAEGADSATQLELLAAAEGELRVAFDAHMKYLSEVCVTKCTTS